MVCPLRLYINHTQPIIPWFTYTCHKTTAWAVSARDARQANKWERLKWPPKIQKPETVSEKIYDSLWWRAGARNVSFLIFLHLQIYLNSVDKNELLAKSAGWQDKVDPVFWLVTKEGTIGPSYPLEIFRVLSPFWPYNKSFTNQACSSRWLGIASSVFAFLSTSNSYLSINTKKRNLENNYSSCPTRRQ